MLDVELPDWTQSPIATPGYTLWMRNTPSNHGPIINLKYLTTEPGKTFESPRRFSVVREANGVFALEIGSVAYTTGYDSFNEPDEIFQKYIDGEFQVLLTAPLADTVGMTSVHDWSGMSQDMRL